MNEIYKILSGIDDFKKFSQSEIYQIASMGIIKKFRKDAFIYYQNDSCDAVYYLISGLVEKIKFRNDYSSILLKSCDKNEWLGIAEAVHAGGYLYDARTKEVSETIVFLKKGFIEYYSNNLKFSTYIGSKIVKELYNAHFHLDTHTPLEKITGLIKARINSFGNNNIDYIELPITQEQLSELIGFTRETVNKSLKKMEKEGFIKLERGKIVCKRERFI
ncbi:MAG: Crp/Fnr family transcriptional regulator [Spirochaetes bacterium]|nr:Crp/Fnr family transcriptional regulator [Spirochaetota bacterium]